jgi:hypothetical protein
VDDVADAIWETIEHGTKSQVRKKDGAQMFVDRRKGIVVVVNPADADGGTAYVSDNPRGDIERFNREADDGNGN